MHTYMHVCICILYEFIDSVCVYVRAYTQIMCAHIHVCTYINTHTHAHAGITKYHTDK